jgi:RHS repeat-associated protein
VPELDQNFGYDNLDRLTSAVVGNTTTQYGYDLNGNRTATTIGSTPYANTVWPTSNQLSAQSTGLGSFSVGYDAAGNITNDGVNGYTYSDRGRMSSATTPAGGVAYLYNGLNERVSKTGSAVAGGAAYYVYDEQGRLLGEYDASGNPVYESVYAQGMPVGVLKQTGQSANATLSTQVYDVYADQIGAPRMVTRPADQAIVWRWDAAEPFEATRPDQNPNGLGAFTYNQRLPGQVFDAETGLYQNWFREYNPRLGRYTQPDPIGLEGGSYSLYQYVNGNPMNSTDVRGLDNPSMGPYGPFWSGLSFRRGVPVDSCTCMLGGNTFYAPPGTNFSAVHRAGQTNGLDPEGVKQNEWQWGKYHFQRDAGKNQFTRAYTDASNFGVGVYMHGAGYGRTMTRLIGGAAAKYGSKNAGDPNQVKYWMMGWDAADSGNLEYVCQ